MVSGPSPGMFPVFSVNSGLISILLDVETGEQQLEIDGLSEALEETALVTEDDDTFQLRLTLPSSAKGHDVSVVLSPRKRRGKSAYPTATPCSLPNNTTAGSQSSVGDVDPFAPVPQVPQVPQAPPVAQLGTHLRPDRIQLPFLSRYSVPEDVRVRFPPGPKTVGWGMMKWYVVWRGYEVGIFYDLWYVFGTQRHLFIFILS
jgi:hypothetical protein